MGSKFGKTNSGFANKGEREKFLFIAAAGTALAVMVIFALVAGFKSGGQPSSQQNSTDQAASLAEAKDSISVICPEAEVAPGTLLSQVRFQKKRWPRATAPEGAFSDFSEVVGFYAKNKLVAGLPLQRQDTTTQESTSKVSTIALTPGNRAVSIEVDDISGLEGHALAGTHVDVVLTYSQGGSLVSNIICLLYTSPSPRD